LHNYFPLSAPWRFSLCEIQPYTFSFLAFLLREQRQQYLPLEITLFVTEFLDFKESNYWQLSVTRGPNNDVRYKRKIRFSQNKRQAGKFCMHSRNKKNGSLFILAGP